MNTLAKKEYKTRLAIESYGLEPIPTELKKTSWFDYFILQMAFSVNSGNFLVPALAVLTGGLSFYAAVLSTLFGAASAFVFVSALSIPGAKYGLPAQYAIRSILGTILSRYIASPIRTITSLYWFCVQTMGGTAVIIELTKKMTTIELPFIPVSLCMAIMMSILALYGFETVKKTIRIFMPLLIVGQFVLLYYFTKTATTGSHTGVLSQGSSDIGVILLYSSLAFVQYISGVSASADMARYAKSVRGAVCGLFLGNVWGFLITAVLAAFSATLMKEWNPFVAAVSFSQSKIFLLLLLFCGIVSMISINLNNAYTGGFSLLNTFQNLGRIKSSLLFGVAAILFSLFPVLIKNAQSYISWLGMLIIPVSAVITSDFLFIKKARLTEEHLEKVLLNQYPINLKALISIAAGTFSYFILPANLSPGFLSFLLTSGLYLFIHKGKRRNERTSL